MPGGNTSEQPLLRPPTLRVEIRILDDGRVVFGDLPPDLAEVAEILGGEPVTCALPGNEPEGLEGAT